MPRPAPLGLESVELPAFRGVNLRDQPDGLKPGQLLDCLNVELTEIGGIRRRPGTQILDSAARAQPIAFVAWMQLSGGARRIIESGTTGGLYAVDTAGVLQHTSGMTATLQSAARFGGPNTPTLYLADGVQSVGKYTAAGFAGPTATTKNLLTGATTAGVAMPKGACVCTWPGEERLLVGGFGNGGTDGPGGLASGEEYVWISEPGQPEVYGTTSFIRLVPGDGEKVQAIVAWREMVFVFKETKYFVFRQISTDSRGIPTFNRQAVDVGIGAVSRKAVAVGSDGVYFVSRRGLMRTRGGDPQLICGELAPLFSGITPFYYHGGAPGLLSSSALAAVGSRLMWSYQSSLPGVTAPDRTWIIDLEHDNDAVLTDLPVVHGVGVRVGETEDLVYAKSGQSTVRRLHRAVTDDDVPFAGGAGTGINSFANGAYLPVAGGRVQRIRHIAAWGAGQVDVGLAVDYREGGPLTQLALGVSSDLWGDGSSSVGENAWGGGTDATDTWGGGASITPKLARRAYKAAYASLRLSSQASGGNPRPIPWAVSRVALQMPNGGNRFAADLTS